MVLLFVDGRTAPKITSGYSEIGPDLPDDSKTAENFRLDLKISLGYRSLRNFPTVAEGVSKMTEDHLGSRKMLLADIWDSFLKVVGDHLVYQ